MESTLMMMMVVNFAIAGRRRHVTFGEGILATMVEFTSEFTNSAVNLGMTEWWKGGVRCCRTETEFTHAATFDGLSGLHRLESSGAHLGFDNGQDTTHHVFALFASWGKNVGVGGD